MGRSRLYHVALVVLGVCLLLWCLTNPWRSRLKIACRNDQFEREYGRTNLRLSRGYEGSSYRLERFMSKVKRGEKVTVSVVGGSVTRGHHVWPEEIWFSRVIKWLGSIGAKVISVNGATPATGSDYYSYCFPLHIPPESDLVLIELGINDSAWEGHVMDMENLLRGLLGMKTEPAVILVEALAFANGGVGGGGGRMHLPVAQFYDVPVINQRLPLVGHFARYPELIRTYFSQNFWGDPDTWHLNSRGHRDLGMLVASLIQDVACSSPLPEKDEQPEASKPWHFDDPLDLPGRFMNSTFPIPIPRQGVLEGWNPDPFFSRSPWKPWCISEQSPDNSTALDPLRTTGWTHWIDPSGQTKPYLTAIEPGARVTFEVQVQMGGEGGAVFDEK